LSQNFLLFFLNIVERLGALKSKSNRQVFLPLAASIVAKFTERSVFPVPPLYEWNVIIVFFPSASITWFRFHGSMTFVSSSQPDLTPAPPVTKPKAGS
jgi:hypothetical protein